MARRDPPTFACDSAGCKSTCTLLATVPDDRVASELAARGWLVNSDGLKHFCPGCAADIVVEPTDTE